MTRKAILGVRVTTDEMDQLQARAAADGCKNLSNWARAALLAALSTPKCSRCAMTDAVLDGLAGQIVDKMDDITCQKCGHTRQIRRIPQFNAPSLPGHDPGCPWCADRARKKPPTVTPDCLLEPFTDAPLVVVGEETVEASFPVPGSAGYRTNPRTWASEWAAMESMEPAEARARFNELRAGRKLPKGFGGWGKAERIAWLDREMPL